MICFLICLEFRLNNCNLNCMLFLLHCCKVFLNLFFRLNLDNMLKGKNIYNLMLNIFREFDFFLGFLICFRLFRFLIFLL